MIQKLKEMSYGAARYYVLKELDERGPIGRLLLSYDTQLASKMMDFCDWIDKVGIAFSNNQPHLIDWNKGDEIPRTIMYCSEKFPFLILAYSELDWNSFLSAWVVVVGEFLALMSHHMQNNDFPPEERGRAERMIRDCEGVMRPTYTLIELGASYLDLIKAGTSLVSEMQKWRQSQPSSIRLSQAYLRALGVIKDEEEGPRNSEPVYDCPPSPNGGPNCNRNEATPPPPPPPPPQN